MLWLPNSGLCFLALATFFRATSGECRQSYITICDNFTDFKNFQNVESVSEIMIGSEHHSNLTSVHLMNTLKLYGYYKLTTLTVVGVINKLETTYGYQCTYYNSPLKYFNLYGNELGTLEAYQFPLVPLKKLSLVNNKIEGMKTWTFRYYKIQNIDLSDNLLEVIEAGALPSTNVTKIITIRRNKLMHIEPDSFPPSLESLNLDNNKLRYIQDEVLENLINIKELTLSHNNFNVIPKISSLKELIIFDISYNKISTIGAGIFQDMDDLKVVDLTSNNIGSPIVLEWIITPGKQPALQISLALNRLRSLDLDKVPHQNQTLALYGNPWDCAEWTELKNNLAGRESKCDKQFISSGNVPYCIDYRSNSYIFSTLWEQDIDRLHDTVRKSVNKAKCKLTLEKYMFLYPPNAGCVA